MNPCVLFYQHKISNQDGNGLNDIWKYNHSDYERDHHFIQWIFPSDEPSSININAPVVDDSAKKAFRRNPILRMRLQKSYRQFLNFIGVSDSLIVTDEGLFYLRVRRRNHNLQRITRVLRSLTILGLRDHAVPFYEFLMGYSNDINEVTIDYWNRAINEAS